MSKKPAEPVAVAAPATPAPVAKAEKGKHPKKHKDEKGVHAMYKAEGDKVTRTRPTCERCGPGYFMADHHNRYTCGHCGFTRYKQK
ncbi:MAG: 30S ribosomal protein S27ae [Candidatus Bathyarchaeota archaeon]|nr:30S ribosomal protein S27ae [Candidatus Bathyarchaeota archaeon]